MDDVLRKEKMKKKSLVPELYRCAASHSVTFTTPPIPGWNAQKNGYTPGSLNVTVKFDKIG
jgi:hypothetical protein